MREGLTKAPSRLRIGILFGGRSAEHAVSTASARSILQALDPAKYLPCLIGITPRGRWVLVEDLDRFAEDPQGGEGVALAPGVPDRPLLRIQASAPAEWVQGTLDVVFPVLHGSYGEDGTVQGLLEMIGLPYVGAGVLGSALGMDKAVTKVAFRQAGLPVVPSRTLRAAEWMRDRRGNLDRLLAALPLPCFVKPSCLGSSVGITKVETPAGLAPAIDEALRYDSKAVIEQGLHCREIECGVLGNTTPEASVLGEIRPKRDWYDYQAKYSEGLTEVLIPAPLPADLTDRIRALALRAFEAVEGAGMARVDFFLDLDSGDPFVSEVNTIPGFTTTSVYPRLWEATGLSYSALVDRLISLALERHAVRSGLVTDFSP